MNPHASARHGDRCPGTSRACGRRVRWHVACSISGCGNFCGIHARVIQRRSLWTAVFGPPIIIDDTKEKAA